ncbi:unnamed protein product, partial [Hapterophycus canaliculatus]
MPTPAVFPLLLCLFAPLPHPTAKSIQYEGIPAQLSWLAESLDYNTKGGKMNRGMGVVDVLRAF